MGYGKDWDLRDAVIAVGVAAGLVFVLVELTGSDFDRHASETLSTALALVLFTIFGSAGVALAHWQPRFSLFGVATATLSLLAFGASVPLVWNGVPFLLGFGFSGTSGTVGGITDLLALAASAACVLLATVRPCEDLGTRLVRVLAIGALAFFIALLILTIVDHDVEIGSRVYAILAAVYLFGTATLLVLRLLSIREELPAPS